MQIKESEINEFIRLYKTYFGIELSKEAAHAKLSKLVRQMEIIYRPITKKQIETLEPADKKTKDKNVH